MKHRAILVLVVAACSCSHKEQPASDDPDFGQPLPYTNPVEQVRFRHIDEVKAAYPAATDWIVHEFEGDRCISCVDRLLSMGVAHRCLRGWKSSDTLNGWRDVVTVHTLGLMSRVTRHDSQPHVIM